MISIDDLASMLDEVSTAKGTNHMKFVFLNGPPRVGKDTIAVELCRLIQRTSGPRHPLPHIYKFAQPLRDMVGLIATANGATHAQIHRMMLPENKDVPNALLDHLPGNPTMFTPREVMIWASEEMFKPRYGNNVLGRMVLARILRASEVPDIVIFSDSGFAPEVEAVVDSQVPWGSNALVVRMHRDGTSFDGDSRSYWLLPESTRASEFRLINDGTPCEAALKLYHQMRDLWPDLMLDVTQGGDADG